MCSFHPCSKFALLQSVEVEDISKQSEQHAHMGKIFARWHLLLAITITSLSN